MVRKAEPIYEFKQNKCDQRMVLLGAGLQKGGTKKTERAGSLLSFSVSVFGMGNVGQGRHGPCPKEASGHSNYDKTIQ